MKKKNNELPIVSRPNHTVKVIRILLVIVLIVIVIWMVWTKLYSSENRLDYSWLFVLCVGWILNMHVLIYSNPTLFIYENGILVRFIWTDIFIKWGDITRIEESMFYTDIYSRKLPFMNRFVSIAHLRFESAITIGKLSENYENVIDIIRYFVY